jgi:hypothetical protein
MLTLGSSFIAMSGLVISLSILFIVVAAICLGLFMVVRAAIETLKGTKI